VLKTEGKALKLSIRFRPGTTRPVETLLSLLSEVFPEEKSPPGVGG